MKKVYLIVPVILILLVVFNSCEYEYIVPEEPPPVDTTDIISFDTIIVPIFNEQNCTNCHQTGGQEFSLSKDDAYGNIVPALVDKDNPELSKIYTIPHPDGDHFQKYTAAQAQNILQWITQGALNN